MLILRLTQVEDCEHAGDGDPHGFVRHVAPWADAASKAERCVGLTHVGVELAVFHEPVRVEAQRVGVDLLVVEDGPEKDDIWSKRTLWSELEDVPSVGDDDGPLRNVVPAVYIIRGRAMRQGWKLDEALEHT